MALGRCVESDFATPEFFGARARGRGRDAARRGDREGPRARRERKETYAERHQLLPPMDLPDHRRRAHGPWEEARQVQAGEKEGRFAFFPVGVKRRTWTSWRRSPTRKPLHLDGLRFRDLFAWLSRSLRGSRSRARATECPYRTRRVPMVGRWSGELDPVALGGDVRPRGRARAGRAAVPRCRLHVASLGPARTSKRSSWSSPMAPAALPKGGRVPRRHAVRSRPR